MAAALAPLIANLVHQTTTGTGTGNLTLSTVSGKQSFNTAFSNGATTDVFYYFISNEGASEYEYGTGHMSDATTLVRDTVIESTNANAAVNLSAGTKDVVCDVPALRQWVAAEVSLASSGTTDLGTYPSASVTITGTTTITSFGSTAKTGTIRFCKFSGALTLTHNSTSLIIPGAANITTAAGDCMCVRHEGSGNWRVLFYQKATGYAIVSSSRLIASGSAGTGTTVSFTSLPSVEEILVVLDQVSHNNGASQTFNIAVSTDNGSSYGTAVTISASVSAASAISGNILISNTNQTAGKVITAISGVTSTAGTFYGRETTLTGVVNAIQLAPSAGNFDAGNVYIYAV